MTLEEDLRTGTYNPKYEYTFGEADTFLKLESIRMCFRGKSAIRSSIPIPTYICFKTKIKHYLIAKCPKLNDIVFEESKSIKKTLKKPDYDGMRTLSIPVLFFSIPYIHFALEDSRIFEHRFDSNKMKTFSSV